MRLRQGDRNKKAAPEHQVKAVKGNSGVDPVYIFVRGWFHLCRAKSLQCWKKSSYQLQRELPRCLDSKGKVIFEPKILPGISHRRFWMSRKYFDRRRLRSEFAVEKPGPGPGAGIETKTVCTKTTVYRKKEDYPGY
jgi:hypothetical protein